jgi:hypothetical protein
MQELIHILDSITEEGDEEMGKQTIVKTKEVNAERRGKLSFDLSDDGSSLGGCGTVHHVGVVAPRHWQSRRHGSHHQLVHLLETYRSTTVHAHV